jgi:hypothetical protein
MSFQASLERRLAERRARTGLIPWLQAILQAPALDRELAAGIRPSASPAHQLRADHLMRRRVRRRIANALNRAVADAPQPERHVTSQAPICREAVRRCSEQIRDLANQVATMQNPPIRGLAIAFQLAFDGRGALFFQPDMRDRPERLANTLDAAHRALRVSADL